jgi:hypothetical protein
MAVAIRTAKPMGIGGGKQAADNFAVSVYLIGFGQLAQNVRANECFRISGAVRSAGFAQGISRARGETGRITGGSGAASEPKLPSQTPARPALQHHFRVLLAIAAA